MRLVQMGCEVNTATSRFNQTPTHTAAFGGHPQCLVWLTQAGADVDRQVSLPHSASTVARCNTERLSLKCVTSDLSYLSPEPGWNCG